MAAVTSAGASASCGAIYVLKHGDQNVYKIGRTLEVETRVKTHETSNPFLVLVDQIDTEHPTDCERYIHRRKRANRLAATKEFFELSPTELTGILADVRSFDAEVLPLIKEAASLSCVESDGRILAPTEQERETWRQLVEVKGQIATLEFEQAALEAKLKVSTGTAAGIDGIATWRSQWVGRLDQAALRRKDPEVFQRFVHRSHERRFILL